MADPVAVNGTQRRATIHRPDRSRLRILDACLNELETAHERDEVIVSVELSARLRPVVPAITAGMRINRAINLVLREQERYLPVGRARADVSREGRRPLMQVIDGEATASEPDRGDEEAPSDLVPAAPHLSALRELVRRTRDMVPLATDAWQAKAMVRRTGAMQRLIGEALKGCRVLEHEQFELKQEAAEAHLRTQRRAGELLAELEKHPGGRPPKTPSKLEEVSDRPPTLHELGIDGHESHRWQRIASVPVQRFEHYVRTVRLRGKELTTAGMLGLAGKSTRQAADGNAALLQRYQRGKHALLRLTKIEPRAIAAAVDPARRRDELRDLGAMRAWLGEVARVLAASTNSQPHSGKTGEAVNLDAFRPEL